MTDIATPTQSVASDPQVIALAQSIRDRESGGNYNAIGDNNTSAGAFQWSNNGVALKPGEAPANFKAGAKQFLGDENAPFTPENQKALAYSQILADKKAGLNPAQIAAKWNSGKTTDWENHKGTVMINGKPVSYDTPAYVKTVMDSYQKYKNGGGQSPAPATPPADPNDPLGGKTFSELYGQPATPNATQTADQTSAQGTGAMFPAVTGESPLSAGVKTLGNVLPSAWNFAKGVVSSLNPVNIAKNVAAIPGAFNDAVTANGGSIGATLGNTATSILPEAYKQLMPAFGQDLIKGDTAAAQRDVTNNPFGSIAPFVFAAEGAGKLADNVATGSATDAFRSSAGEGEPAVAGPVKPVTTFSDMVNKPMSAVTDLATKPVRAFGNFVADNVPKIGKYAFGQATGLEPSTIETRIANPKVDMSTVNRASLGETVNTALQDRIDNLSESGKGYQAIRSDATPIKVAPEDLSSMIKDNTGLDFNEASAPIEKTAKGELPTIQMEEPKMTKGQWSANSTSDIRQSADVAKIQKLYDFWQPTFESGKMTPEQFLNLRSDLGDIAKFDNGIGKSAPLDRVAQGMYSDLNSTYRSDISGLTDKDAEFSSLKSDLQRLQKGFIDKNGNLTDGAINKVANALGKGKDPVIARLEEISPGISKQIQILKMAEDFERAAGSKVGTYTRSTIGAAGLGAGVVTGNIPMIAASLAEIVLQTPTVADAIIKTYAKSKPLLQAVADKLRSGVSATNNLPNTLPTKLQNSTVFGRPQLTQ